MAAISQNLTARARTRLADLADRFTPELKRQIARFTLASLGVAIIALIVLALIGATYEPFAWTVLVLTGAAYGWFARTELVRDELWSVIDRCEAYIATLEARLDDAEEDDDLYNTRPEED